MYKPRAIWNRESRFAKLTRVQQAVLRMHPFWGTEQWNQTAVADWYSVLVSDIWQTRGGKAYLTHANMISATIDRDRQTAAYLRELLGEPVYVHTANSGSQYVHVGYAETMRVYRLSDHAYERGWIAPMGASAEEIALAIRKIENRQ